MKTDMLFNIVYRTKYENFFFALCFAQFTLSLHANHFLYADKWLLHKERLHEIQELLKKS